jgi:hypothetical protein
LFSTSDVCSFSSSVSISLTLFRGGDWLCFEEVIATLIDYFFLKGLLDIDKS